MNYIELLEGTIFYPIGKCSVQELHDFQERIGFNVPESYKEFLLSTNGIDDFFGCPCIWSNDYVIKENFRLRDNQIIKESYKPINNILFIAEAGNGDYFGFDFDSNDGIAEHIVVWNHEDDTRIKIRDDFQEFYTDYVLGRLKI